jgi:uncharacterized protein YukE
MSFKVETDSLAKLPDMLDRLKEDADHAKEYVTEHTSVQYEGFLNSVQGGHEHVVQQVTGWLTGVGGKVAAPTAEAVKAALVYYRTSDANAQATLDGSYAASPIEQAPEDYTYYAYSRAVAAFEDKEEPGDSLREVEDRNGEFPYEPSWMDAGSPAQLCRDVVYEATNLATQLGLMDRPIDPYEDVCKWFAGDWAGFAECRDVFDNLANACQSMSANLHWGARSIESVWQGNAADGCENHLFKAADAVSEVSEPLRELGEKYVEAAEAMHKLGSAMGTCISALVDACIMAAANAAWGAATTEFGVGLIGDAIAAYEVYEVVEKVHECFEILHQAQALVELTDSTLHGMGDLAGTEVDLPVLPDGVPTLPSAA